ncbi:uncharacterized protein FOMMEDRAFT_28501 [Fomitiporia mediterranea MF3/22]|uniref:uncharacterized protein n=1 Tax=Fomitiporia mediterranea (strain MF3/22) TaxID=694068 RepID=UPI00044093D3|nr:uncharacterized protein FOMMEDRAFT_28501 [Fomitiporia mediterranea MF3/22]EJD02841.1 hypothetical protein FOMMEDRAFT_28501 [Fomitiporia mediterranea MF3/22]
MFSLPNSATDTFVNTTVSGGPIEVVWTVAQGDPATFTIDFFNINVLSLIYKYPNVDSNHGPLLLTLPNVTVGSFGSDPTSTNPMVINVVSIIVVVDTWYFDSDGYRLQLVDTDNEADVLAQSEDFAIGAAQPTTTSLLSSATFSFLTATSLLINTVSPSNLISSSTAQTTASSSTQADGTGAPVPTDRSTVSSVSKAKVAGIVAGVVASAIICLAILLYVRRRTLYWPSIVRRRYNKKGIAEVPELHGVVENGNSVVPLILPRESGRRSWTSDKGEHGRQARPESRRPTNEATDNRTNQKHAAPVPNITPENLQPIVEPMSSVMQEVDGLHVRIAELEQQLQETRQNLRPPSIDSGAANDNRSAPPAYSDDGRY